MNFLHKYIKHPLLFVIPALVTMALSSCKKLIQIAPNAPNQLVAAQVFADSADATAAIVQLYTGFSYVVLAPQAGGLTVYPALSADELKNTETDVFLSSCYADDILVNDGTLDGAWIDFYGTNTGGIYQANACLEGITASTGISSSLKNQLIGEAEFMRAFWYFHLVSWFGGVPLVTTTNYLANAVLPRAADTAVYTQIIADLKDAEQRLTLNYPSDGRARANLYTAEALLAKVYLYKKDWANASREASNIINAGQYSLEDSLDDVFLHGSNEAILQVLSIFPSVQCIEGTVFVPKTTNVIPKFILTPTLLNAFEPGDKRLSHWVNNISVTSGATTTSYTYPYKYKNGSAPEDYMVFRLGEQYLIRAEAASESGDQGGAIADLNTIRARAGLPAYAGSNDPAAVQQAIFHERQIELFCEWGNRWQDLKRTGQVNAVLAAEKPGTWPADGHAVLYPIPLTEIQKNNALKQNPGYQ